MDESGLVIHHKVFENNSLKEAGNCLDMRTLEIRYSSALGYELLFAVIFMLNS